MYDTNTNDTTDEGLSENWYEEFLNRVDYIRKNSLGGKTLEQIADEGKQFFNEHQAERDKHDIFNYHGQILADDYDYKALRQDRAFV
ncbi:MAG: hypothetical protein LBN42_04700 [Oscillospiraceae bacterium]|jgi:hypothetical protein|nr:hypothetical protein [Oscillospiraceae bacterium]